MNNKGAYFTLEALFTFLVFIALISWALPVQQENFNEVIIMQKAHDVLKVWNMQDSTESDLIGLAIKVFPDNAFSIEVDDHQIYSQGELTDGKLAVSGRVFNQGVFKKTVITVYF